MTTRAQQAKAAGKCVRCLHRPALKSGVRCKRCKWRQNAYMVEYRAGVKARGQRKAAGRV